MPALLMILLASCPAQSAQSAQSAQPAQSADGVLAILPLGGDAPAASRALLDERVRIAAGRYRAVQDQGVTMQALKTAGLLGLACDTALPSCAQQMAGLSSAARALSGALDARGELTLFVVEVDTRGAVPITQRALLPDPGVAQDAAIERVVLQLLAPERVTGRLHVLAGPPGARIVVDGIFRGSAPLTTPLLLEPGLHRVEVTMPGYLAQAATIALEAAAVERVAIELARDLSYPINSTAPDDSDRARGAPLAQDDAAPHELDGAAPGQPEPGHGQGARSRLAPVLFWTAAGAGGAMAVATAVAGAVALTAEDPRDAGRAGALFAVGAGGTVAALGAAALVGVLIDW